MYDLRIPAQYMNQWNQLNAAVAPHYRPLQFHDQPHAMVDTMNAAFEQRATLEARGFRMNTLVLMAGIAIHDLENWKPIDGTVFGSFEERSAAIGAPLLRGIGYSEQAVTHGAVPIVIATTPGVHCETVPERVAVRSDLVNTAQEEKPWEDVTMLSNSVKLFFEANQLRREREDDPIGWTEFIVEKQQPLLRKYEVNLSADIDVDRDLNDKFLRHFRPNVAFLSDDRVADPERFFGNFGAGIAKIVPFPIRVEDFTGKAAA